MKSQNLPRLALAVFAVVSIPSLAASSATGTLNVQASVVDSCSVTGATLNFGNYDPRSGAAQDAQTNITVRCTNSTPYAVQMDAGLGQGALATDRIMTSGPSGALHYTLYTDASRTAPWGDGVDNGDAVDGTGSGIDQSITVYGRILAGQQQALVGNYSDTVTITVAY